MCGRYTVANNLNEIMSFFEAGEGARGTGENRLWDWKANYNIAPAAIVPVIAFDGQGRRKAVPMRWGLHPHWKKQAPEGRPLFNARLETAGEKPSFRTPFRRRRALIPASGWYEWEGVERPKTPYFIRPREPELFAFAGLWDQWRVDEGITLLSCTILTTAATGPLKHLHHRMPVRLPAGQWDQWLDWNAHPDRVIRHMLPSDDLSFHAVDTGVNSGRAQGPELIRPLS